MKTRFSLLLFVIPLVLEAQVIITQSDMPSSGDTIRQSNSVNIGFIDFEETGPDFTWDFSPLVPFSQSVDSFVSVSETPLFYQLLFFFTANLAQKEFEFEQFPGFQVTDSYRFYKNSSSSFQEVGFGVTLNGLPLPTLYDDPDVIYQFPVEAGNVDSSFASYEFDIPGLGYYGGWKKRKNEVDGWGQATTPYGTFEVLRLKTEILQYDSLYIDSLGFGLPLYQELTEYKWLGEGLGLPLLHVVDNGIVQTVAYLDSLRTLFTGTAAEIRFRSLHVYPNPAHRYFRIDTGIASGESYVLNIFDMEGRLVQKETGKTRDGLLDVKLNATILPGSYVLVLDSNGQVFTEQLQVR